MKYVTLYQYVNDLITMLWPDSLVRLKSNHFYFCFDLPNNDDILNRSM